MGYSEHEFRLMDQRFSEMEARRTERLRLAATPEAQAEAARVAALIAKTTAERAAYLAKLAASVERCRLLVGEIRATRARGTGDTSMPLRWLADELSELGHTALGIAVMRGRPLRDVLDDMLPNWGE